MQHQIRRGYPSPNLTFGRNIRVHLGAGSAGGQLERQLLISLDVGRIQRSCNQRFRPQPRRVRTQLVSFTGAGGWGGGLNQNETHRPTLEEGAY